MSKHMPEAISNQLLCFKCPQTVYIQYDQKETIVLYWARLSPPFLPEFTVLFSDILSAVISKVKN